MASDFSTKDYYQLLNVERTASKEEIKAAYKSIALVYHPDSNFFDEILDSANGKETQESNEDFFKLLTAAYNTLSNPNSREEYNRTLAPELPGWNQKTETSNNNWYASQNNSTAGVLNRAVPSSAFGVFGSSSDEEYDFEGGGYGTKPGLLSRIFSLFGG